MSNIHNNSRVQQQPSWLKRIFGDPLHAELDYEIHRLISRAKDVNRMWMDRANKPLYHDLFMGWLDAASRSGNIHHKQLVLLSFLLTDEEFRKHVAAYEPNTHKFNRFLKKVEIYIQNMVYGVQITNGAKYIITESSQREQDASHHCGHLVILITHLVNSS
jgi:hypothetical protein